MRCSACGWPATEAEVLSRHRTSEGIVSDLRCVCGELTVRLDPGAGCVVATAGRGDRPRRVSR
jgi:hypothetical protein